MYPKQQENNKKTTIQKYEKKLIPFRNVAADLHNLDDGTIVND